jgi:hypothetical protein
MTVSIIEQHLHSIIDELHPLFTPISDEEMVEHQEDHGVYTRDFLHKFGKKFRMKWSVYYGTPETVRTEFKPVEVLQ